MNGIHVQKAAFHPPIMWHHKAHLWHCEKILAMVPESVELSRELHLS